MRLEKAHSLPDTSGGPALSAEPTTRFLVLLALLKLFQ